MQGVLNERTQKVHKLESGGADPRPECGATNRVEHDEISVLPVEEAVDRSGIDRCGRCFADAGGY
ncbi:hypothetical protein ACKVMT_15950 [Halobacteriales archaeon Cl-PHB]